MRRREFIAVVSGAALTWPLSARAQLSGRVPRIGVLFHAGSAEQEGPYFTAVIDGFRELGYIEGRTITFEHRFPNEVPERFTSMAAELVATVDVLIAVGDRAAVYAKNATSDCIRARPRPCWQQSSEQLCSARRKRHRHVELCV